MLLNRLYINPLQKTIKIKKTAIYIQTKSEFVNTNSVPSPINNPIIHNTMGKYLNILSPISGKVGPVVGSSIYGIHYLRAYNGNPRNPKTELQTNQRGKFKICMDFLRPLNPILKIGWAGAKKMSPMNAAMKYHLLNAITGTTPEDFAIDTEKIVLSRGNLTPPIGASANAQNGEVVFTWSDNSDSPGAQPNDKAIVCLVNTNNNEVVFEIAADREELTKSLMTPSAWISQRVCAYMSFVSTDSKTVSNSVYIGKVTVQ